MTRSFHWGQYLGWGLAYLHFCFFVITTLWDEYFHLHFIQEDLKVRGRKYPFHVNGTTSIWALTEPVSPALPILHASGGKWEWGDRPLISPGMHLAFRKLLAVMAFSSSFHVYLNRRWKELSWFLLHQCVRFTTNNAMLSQWKHLAYGSWGKGFIKLCMSLLQK